MHSGIYKLYGAKFNIYEGVKMRSHFNTLCDKREFNDSNISTVSNSHYDQWPHKL